MDSLNLAPAYSEIILAVGALALLMLGVFKGDKSVGLVSWLSAALMVLCVFIIASLPEGRSFSFGNMFVTDGFTSFMKILILIASAAAIAMSISFFEQENAGKFELPIIMTLATTGMLVMVSANDLMTLYMGLELQSLSLYVLAAFRRGSTRSTEAGLKYFILGALSSGMLLYGSSLIYGFIGTMNFTAIAGVLSHTGEHGPSIGVVIGLVFILSGLAFKISAVPFHMWTPDVYEGAPTPITSFFAVAPKIAALALLLRVIEVPFGTMEASWSQIIFFMSILSMILGSTAAIMQFNIKRLMAYSSIGHIGFALMAMASGSELGVSGILYYMSIYLVTNVGVFACIMGMRRKDGMTENINDLAGLAKSRPAMAAAIALFMFSLAGIPPLVGFYAKFYVIGAAVAEGHYVLSGIAFIASVIGAFYYLRIIKIMYFDEGEPDFIVQKSLLMRGITFVSAAGMIFIGFPQISAPLKEAAVAAAKALLS